MCSISASAALADAAFQSVLDEVLASHFNMIAEMYNVGVRNFFWMDLPPLQFSPTVLAQPAPAPQQWTDHIHVYNAALQTNVDAFKAAHTDVREHPYLASQH